MARKKEPVDPAAAAATAEGRSPASGRGRARRPTLRLTGVRVMDAERQRRFESLIGALLRRWAGRGGGGGGGDDNDGGPEP